MSIPTATAEPLSMILLMGVTGAGKSYFINQLVGRQVVTEGASLDSCTQHCQLIPVQIGATKVLAIDTPGFDDTVRTDSEVLSEIARILAAQYELGVELKGVIYIHRITDVRYSHSAIKTFEIFKKVCGEGALKNVLLVTSRWMEVDQQLGADRERQLREKFWAYMLGHGSSMSRFHGNRDSAISLVSQLLCKSTIVLELQRELVDHGKRLDETVAGSYVSDNLEKLKAEYEAELAGLERLRQTLLDSDRAMKRQLQLDWDKEMQRLRIAQEQQNNLHQPVAAEVHQQIDNAKKKKRGIMKMLPFLPTCISLLGMFVGIPPGMTDVLTSWFSDAGATFDSSWFGDIFSS